MVVSSELTKEKVKEHYGCSDLEGMELDNDINARPVGHWVGRIAKDELMAVPRESGAGYYTALTMSTFESLGYYKANWGMEEPMGWGNRSGCDFLKGNCKKDNKL
ncbi:putative surface protease GP63, partial [Trypanosoma theileri]